ncbi:hypothetical protein GOP47_0016032 [Adiantum capillus-veneris]|uniref:Uncharacterized protein n=1 Tax=Adiantum capillus-veneris TaxID=13818 RepID=A0A9D4ZEI7_ADICA|nr:hypothetical protein GOP47_0016032 [Adiantum capillus-veneris]
MELTPQLSLKAVHHLFFAYTPPYMSSCRCYPCMNWRPPSTHHGLASLLLLDGATLQPSPSSAPRRSSGGLFLHAGRWRLTLLLMAWPLPPVIWPLPAAPCTLLPH